MLPEWAGNPADWLKVAVMAFIMVYLANWALRKAGLTEFTTTGK